MFNYILRVSKFKEEDLIETKCILRKIIALLTYDDDYNLIADSY